MAAAILSLVTLFLSMVSQSLMDLFGTIFILYALFLVFKNKQLLPDFKSVLRSNYFIFFYIWVLWIVISFLFGASTYHRMAGRVLEFRWILYLFCYVYVLKQMTENLLKYFLYMLGLMCFFSLHIFFTDKNYMTNAPFTMKILRAGGFLNDPMTFAHGVGLLFMFLVGYCSQAKMFSKKWVLAALFFILASIVMTLTRGVWIAVVASLGVFFFIRSWKQVFAFFVLVLILMGIGYSISVNFRSRIDQAIHFKTSDDMDRTALWKTNWYIFENNPVFGIGYGENKHRLREFYDQLNYPPDQFEGNAHSQYLNFLSGTGLIGLLFYFVWIFGNLYWAFKLSRNKEVSLHMQALGFGSFLAQIVFIVGGLAEANFEHSKIKTIITLFWAISFYSYYISKIKKLPEAA